ncbi:MAG TPA: alpha/beta fold hydrolase [Candidatus Acidoferrales bacterium]|nr:alpha/beta fold hydrolase [Candidatus Acidoferrales bacterium]
MKRFYSILIILTFTAVKLWAGNNEIKTQHISFSCSIDGKNYRLEAMLYFPSDSGNQHSLIIMTHGRNGPNPPIDKREVFRYRPLCEALANKGFVVMMLVRRGYGNSEGPDCEYLETAEESGLAGAQDVKAAADYMSTAPYASNGRVVVIGQSQGGWVALAASTLGIKGVLGTVNVSGATNFRRASGFSIRSSMVEDQLDNSAAAYGKSSKVPTLWIYAENDNHLPATVKRWFDSYKQGGGRGELVIKPAYGDNGHKIVGEPDLYIDDILNFFKEIGFSK